MNRGAVLQRIGEIRDELRAKQGEVHPKTKPSFFRKGRYKSDIVCLLDILWAIEKGEQYVHMARDTDRVRSNPALMSYIQELAEMDDPIAGAIVREKVEDAEIYPVPNYASGFSILIVLIMFASIAIRSHDRENMVFVASLLSAVVVVVILIIRYKGRKNKSKKQ